jgi:hypothetical protein
MTSATAERRTENVADDTPVSAGLVRLQSALTRQLSARVAYATAVRSAVGAAPNDNESSKASAGDRHTPAVTVIARTTVVVPARPVAVMV